MKRLKYFYILNLYFNINLVYMDTDLTDDEKYNGWKNKYTRYANYYLQGYSISKKTYSLEDLQKEIKRCFSISDYDKRKKASLNLSDKIIDKMLSYYPTAIDKTVTKCMNIAYKKNKDYGSANILDFGISGLLVRINDKLARLINLEKLKSRSVKDETIEDTIEDIINYSIYLKMLSVEVWF